MSGVPSVPAVPTPNPTSVEAADQIKSVIKEFQALKGVHSAFNGYLKSSYNLNEDIYYNIHEGLSKALKDHPSIDAVEFAIKQVVNTAGQTCNEQTITVLFRVLESLVSSGIMPARLVCESLLDSESLVYKNSVFWNKSFVLMRKIIGGTDYKGVREIMKICLEKISLFPSQVPQTCLPQLNAIVRLLTHIFDRNACLLPAYFIVNEILKAYPEPKRFPHWSVSNLLSEFVDSFRPTSQIVQLVGRSNMLPVVEHWGHAHHLVHPWKLDPLTLRFGLKGTLPYDKELLQPQEKLLRYILEQPYSRDMCCAILGLQKQHKVRCVALEERLVELVMSAMERTETEMNQANDSQAGFEEISGATLYMWQHLSTQLIFFVLFQFASFPHIVMAVNDKLAEVKLFKGRDFLMWILLQFISGSIQKNPLSDFLPVLRLYDLLYEADKDEPLPLPDMGKPYCTSQMAACCIWIHVMKKAQTENTSLPRPLPLALKKQYEYLDSLVQPNNGNTTQFPSLQANDFRIPLLCNAFSTNQEHFSRPMAALVEAIHGTGNSQNQNSAPLSVQILDSLTVHTKMSLIHNIVTHIMKVAQAKTNQNLAPALIETYARLLVYMEIESLGIKGFISTLLQAVCNAQAWGILHTLLEMFCYRLHHIQPHYRVQLLSRLHTLGSNAHIKLSQLHLCIEATALRLITGTDEIKLISESKSLVSTDSEELNKALVLTLARCIHISGSDSSSGTWFREILTTIMQHTPHNWSTHTLQCFPPVLTDFFQQNSLTKENKEQLKSMVDEEYRNWSAMSGNEQELIEHFSLHGSPPLFLCVVWKMIIETDRVSPVAFKVLERIGSKGISVHLRKFCDYVVSEFANAGAGNFVNKLADGVTDMIWKYNIVPFDRLLLCMALRANEGNEAQVCFFIIHMLLVKPPEFRNRIHEFVSNNSPEHWKLSDWHEKHKQFHTTFPEKFMFEDSKQAQLPVYFGNVCLRFLPVFDIVIHRFLEINVVVKSLEMILDHIGSIYKFHDRPITYLYHTFHYYESRLRDKPSLKKKLCSSIIGSLKNVKAPNWALTETYNNYLASSEESWTPDAEYYASLISRFVDVIEGKRKFFTGVDWRYSEFPNPVAHVLYSTCLEIMALPVLPSQAASHIIQVVTQGRTYLDSVEMGLEQIEGWFSATGLILVSLPDTYWLVLHDKIMSCLEKMNSWSFKYSPLVLFNFKRVHNGFLYSEYAYLLALAHSVWHHLGTGHIYHIHQLMEKFTTVIKNEIQLLFVCHLVMPFLQRFNSEKPQLVCKLTITLYELLEVVDKATSGDLIYMDIFCDLLYHIKYMFTGDIVKNEIEAKIRNLRPTLQLRLRFITHLNLEDIPASNTSVGSGNKNSNLSQSIQSGSMGSDS